MPKNFQVFSFSEFFNITQQNTLDPKLLKLGEQFLSNMSAEPEHAHLARQALKNQLIDFMKKDVKETNQVMNPGRSMDMAKKQRRRIVEAQTYRQMP